MRRYIQLALGLGIAVVCLYFAFRGISFSELWQSLGRARPLPILFGLILYLVEYSVRSERWAILIKPVYPAKAAELFWVMIIGFFVNNILPFRMGELVRAQVCGSKFKISRTASLGTILLERLFDTLSFLTTFLVASLFFPFPANMKKGAYLLGGLCLAVALAILLLYRHEETLHRFLAWSPLPPHWKERLGDIATHFIHSTSGILQPRFTMEAMAFSLIVWVIEGTFLYLVGLAFQIPLTYAGSFFLLFALGLSVTLPQAPGYVGTFEIFGVTALSLMGIPKNQGLPVILAVHGLQFIFIAVMGSLALAKENISFHNLLTIR